MTQFSYVAYTAAGEKKKGTMQSPTRKEVVAALQSSGLFVAKVRKNRKSSQKLSSAQLIAFTIQLRELLEAKLPLYEALVSIQEGAQGESSAALLTTLCEEVQGGSSLSDVLERFPQTFSTLYVALVRSGEAVGALDKVLSRICDFLLSQDQLKKDLMQAMIYPAVLGSFSLVVIFALLGFVVPSMEGMFEGKEVTGITYVVMGASHVIRDHGVSMLLLLLSGLGLLVWGMRSSVGERLWQKWKLQLPGIRTLTLHASMSRFARTLGTLLEGGVPLVEALKISEAVVQNVWIAQDLSRARQHILEGSRLSKELGKSKCFPPLFCKMVRIGEETGETARSCLQLSIMYEKDLQKNLGQLVQLAQPVILLVMGGIIGLVMMAVLMPLTQMASTF